MPGEFVSVHSIVTVTRNSLPKHAKCEGQTGGRIPALFQLNLFGITCLASVNQRLVVIWALIGSRVTPLRCLSMRGVLKTSFCCGWSPLGSTTPPPCVVPSGVRALSDDYPFEGADEGVANRLNVRDPTVGCLANRSLMIKHCTKGQGRRGFFGGCFPFLGENRTRILMARPETKCAKKNEKSLDTPLELTVISLVSSS